MPERVITVTAGPCAAESEQQVMGTARNIAAVRDIAADYGIRYKERGGAWKPRTAYKNNGGKVYEGAGEIGLKWLAKAAEKYSLPIVSEVMSEMDLRHFQRHLDPDRDYLQVGARTSKAYALLYAIGGTTFNVMLKSPEHGVDAEEAKGCIDRFEKNRSVVYCVRGQKPPINPIENGEGYNNYMKALFLDKDQYPDARNMNNISAIARLRSDDYFRNIEICYDPSHAIGGRNDLMRRRIGEYAIKAVTDFGYNWIMVEVDDMSAVSKCDGPQALLTTVNGVDWSQTNAKKQPVIMPITLVDITQKFMESQAAIMGISETRLGDDIRKLREIRWGAAP